MILLLHARRATSFQSLPYILRQGYICADWVREDAMQKWTSYWKCVLNKCETPRSRAAREKKQSASASSLLHLCTLFPSRPSVRVPRVQNSESCARSSLFANESSERETRPSIQLLAWREQALCCWDREKQFRINIFSHAAIYLYGPQQVIFALASQKYWFFIMDVFVNLVAPKFATRWRHRYIRKLDTLCVEFWVHHGSNRFWVWKAFIWCPNWTVKRSVIL